MTPTCSQSYSPVTAKSSTSDKAFGLPPLHERLVSDTKRSGCRTVVYATSAPVDEPVSVIIDRPFLFRIVDDTTGAPLFVGRIMDPTA